MAEKLKPSVCHKCGVPRVDNPHPDAGKPDRMLEVGCPQECLPCTVLSRHQWAQRAYAAEKRIRELESALESRASNAGGAVAYCTYPKCQGAAGCTGVCAPYTHPTPASKEPVADERCNRCGHENHSGSCVNVHPDKTPIKQESTLDGLRDCLQKMVDANLEDSLGPNHLALCLKQMAYEALELIQKVQPVADERAASEFDSPLSDFQEGQWWVKELDALGSTGTDDQKRAIAVVHHMLRSARAALATAQTVPNGWKLIPLLATPEMVEAFRKAYKDGSIWNERLVHALRAMLAAAPAKPEGV
ncbi:hypothetical protein [Cupriavidus campinensis]